VNVSMVGSLETNWIPYPQIPPEDINTSFLWNVKAEVKVRGNTQKCSHACYVNCSAWIWYCL